MGVNELEFQVLTWTGTGATNLGLVLQLVRFRSSSNNSCRWLDLGSGNGNVTIIWISAGPGLTQCNLMGSSLHGLKHCLPEEFSQQTYHVKGNFSISILWFYPFSSLLPNSSTALTSHSYFVNLRKFPKCPRTIWEIPENTQQSYYVWALYSWRWSVGERKDRRVEKNHVKYE